MKFSRSKIMSTRLQKFPENEVISLKNEHMICEVNDKIVVLKIINDYIYKLEGLKRIKYDESA